MARLKSKPDIKSLSIDAGLMRQQFDQLASAAPRLVDRPLNHLFADAFASPARGNTDVLDQAAPRSLPTQSRQDAKLQAADDGAIIAFRHHQLDVVVGFERLERCELSRRQRICDTFAAAAERNVGQHGDNIGDVVAPGRPDSDARSAHDLLSGDQPT
jgi:hypothetical protein